MKELYKALAAFQQDVPNIYKNATGFGYKFADLGEINDVIKPILKKHGLGYVQPLQGAAIQTIVFHVESGESIESLVEIPQDVSLAKMNTFQVMGSGITYYRRYSLSSMLGLITDEGADAAGEQLKKERKANTDFTTSGPDQEILARAKYAINEQLQKQGYDTAESKMLFINSVLKKRTIDNLNDCDAVADALDNEKDSPINKGEQYE